MRAAPFIRRISGAGRSDVGASGSAQFVRRLLDILAVLLLLAVPTQAGHVEAQPCATDCTNDGAGINITGTGTGTAWLKLNGSPVLSPLASVISPIISPESAVNHPGGGGGATYQGLPAVIGYARTDSAPGIGTYVNQTTDNLTINGTITNHWGEQENTLNLVAGTGTPTINVEFNQEKSWVIVPSGLTVRHRGENKEIQLDNHGTVAYWDNILSVPLNEATGTITGEAIAYEAFPWNQNKSANSWKAYIGYHCSASVGPGAITEKWCLFNGDKTQSINNMGHWYTWPAAVGGLTPTISDGCGAGASLSTESSDTASTVTIGTSPGATCVLTFQQPVTYTPNGVVTSPSGASLSAGYSFNGNGLTINRPIAGASYSYVAVMGASP